MTRFRFPADLLIPSLLLIGLVLAMTALDTTFVSSRNIYAIFQSMALLGLVALGLSLTMVAGEFDLSVGSMVAVGGLITLLAGDESLVVGMLAAVCFGLGIGAVNALIIHRLNVSSLVVTVGTMIALLGFAFWLAGGRVVSTDSFDLGFFLDDPVLGVFSPRSLITIAAFLFVWAMMRFTLVGRDIRVVGSRRPMAAASGARVGVSIFAAFTLSGGFSALAGSLLSMSLASAAATTGGTIMLQAVSAAIVGGVALTGGAGGPIGVLIGTLVLATMNNGLSLLGLGAATIAFANGIVLMAVVLIDGRLGDHLKDLMRKHRSTQPV